MTCLYGTQYSMLADVYTEYSQTNKKTGQKIKDWQYVKTINCDAKLLNATISRTDFEKFGDTYTSGTAIVIKASERLDSNARLYNIRINGDTLWKEDDETPTIFEIVTHNPIIGPFSSVQGYEMVCTRSTDQRLYP